MKKRILSTILGLALVATTVLVPASAFAAGKTVTHKVGEINEGGARL